MIQYDLDRIDVISGLIETTSLVDGEPGALPRVTEYGSVPGLQAYCADSPDALVDPNDYKEVIQSCHEQKVFPQYHQAATWCPDGKRWNQDGLPYCWAWGTTTGLQDCAAREGKNWPLLSPVSLGHCVGWRKRGNYLDDVVQGAMERGVCSQAFTPDNHSRDYRRYKDDWEEDALKHRIHEAWDINTRSGDARTIQECITVLRTGTSVPVTYNWWNHIVCVIGLEWDESQTNNLVWIIRNSHNENAPIRLTGRRAVPDDAVGIRATTGE